MAPTPIASNLNPAKAAPAVVGIKQIAEFTDGIVQPRTPLHLVKDAERLGDHSLALAPFEFQPRYNRQALSIGVVALGGFSRIFRALVADTINDFLNQHHDEPKHQCWGVLAVGFTREETIRNSNEQDGLYTKVGVESGPNGEIIYTPSINGCIKGAAHAAHDGQLVIDSIAAQGTKLVTMSILAKNYFLGKNGGIDRTRSGELATDIDSLDPERLPSTALGLLVAGLKRRMECCGEPITVMACDNLPPPSGQVLRDAILSFIEQKYGGNCTLFKWVEKNVYCPNVMVDRICPEEKDEWIGITKQQIGLLDKLVVFTEPDEARSIVIEIRGVDGAGFAMNSPFREVPGVRFTTSDGARYGLVKEAAVNAAHVYLTLIGEFYLNDPCVHDVIRHGPLRAGIDGFFDSELIPSIAHHAPDSMDLVGHYVPLVRRRFNNSGLPDKVSRISNECHGRLRRPIAIIDRLVDLSKSGDPEPIVIDQVCNALAAWVITRSLGVAAKGRQISTKELPAVLDRIAEAKTQCRFADLISEGRPSAAVHQVFAVMCSLGLFGDTSNHPVFRESMRRALDRMLSEVGCMQ